MSRTRPPSPGGRGQGEGHPVKVVRARELREQTTKAEARLWRHLRDRRLGGFKFRRQHPVGNFIADFFCDEAKLAIEIDGGGHGFRQQAAYDAERTAELGNEGFEF